MLTAAEILTPAYSMAGFVALIGYIPQVKRFLSDPDVCARTPLLTWTLWAFQTVVFFLYAVLVNGDGLFMLNTLLFMSATLLCYGILIFQKFEGMMYWRFVRRKAYVTSQMPVLRPMMAVMLAIGLSFR